MARTAAHRTIRSSALRACVAGAAAVTGCIATATPATAAPAAPVTYRFDPGVACDFAVQLVIGGDSKRNSRTFTDRAGNKVELITGAAESVLVTGNGNSVTVPSRGARTEITMHADGSQTYEFTGNLLLVLFDTDLGGDGLTATSTTLIAGRTVFTVDESDVYTVQSVTGKTTDICAVLAS